MSFPPPIFVPPIPEPTFLLVEGTPTQMPTPQTPKHNVVSTLESKEKELKSEKKITNSPAKRDLQIKNETWQQQQLNSPNKRERNKRSQKGSREARNIRTSHRRGLYRRF